MECAGRALSFWAYQTTQDIHYHQYLYRTAAEKNSDLNAHFTRAMNDAGSQIEMLQNKLSGSCYSHMQQKPTSLTELSSNV